MFIIKRKCVEFCCRLFVGGAIGCGVGITSPAAFGQEKGNDDLAARLANLEKRIEGERKKQHIPGVAIAVVKDDKVVLAKGFGYSDIERKQPVTTESLFAIGSATKAFTAALIGMLADDSKMSWDDPVEKHIPEFRLEVDTGDEKITVRDLLCHRTGFTRMGVLWAAGRLTRAEVIEHAAAAKPYADFRKKFLYNNIMYMAAGIAAGNAADSDWESLVAARILSPLNMTDSTTSITEAQQDERLAKGYLWDEDKQTHKRLPMRNIDVIGPAGSINSNVKDIAQWVRFQLGKGEYEGRQLLGVDTHAETWKQQIEMTPGAGYGLGWMLREWNGKKVIEHGGSTDGFAAQVTLLPEHDLGYVLLTNVTATPLQQKSINIVFDSLVRGASDDPAAVKSEDVGGLLGKYVANFGPFRDKRFTVFVKDGQLAVDVPGQRVYELKAPNAEGKWYFALTNQIAVSFKQNEAGESTSLTMYQKGLEFECPREGVELEAEVPLKELQPLIGTYRDEATKRNIKVIVLNNRLAVELSGNGVFELFPPDDKQKWAFRANRKRLQVRFNKAKDGSILSMTRFENGKEFEMPRASAGAKDSIPSVESLITHVRDGYGADRVADLGHIRLTGTVAFVHQGVQGKATLLISGLDRFLSESDLGKLGYIRAAYDGQRGWSDSDFHPFEELSGPRLKQLKYGHPLWFLQNWREAFDSAVIVQPGEVDSEKVFVLKLSAKGLPPHTLHVSAASGLVLKEETAAIAPGIGQLPVTLTYADYRPVNGVMLPFKIVSNSPQSGQIVTQFERATSPLDELNRDAFQLTPKSD
ncbi:MAG: beta-lactamase family protein [Planctomycetes bacterium]|nr:beta-lactamase family protein [Planctomycetota bacterium]